MESFNEFLYLARLFLNKLKKLSAKWNIMVLW